MDILREFFDPVPLAALAAAAAALIVIMVITKIFRMPDEFALREKVRDEIRFRVTSERRANLTSDDVEGKLEAAGDETGAEEGEEGGAET